MAGQQTAVAPRGPPPCLKPLQRPLEVLGELSMFTGSAVASIFRRPYRVGLLLAHTEFMAWGSMFVVGLTGLFTGMVLALQTVYAFGLFNAQSLVGATVELSLARELAPIFTCIVLLARVGSAATNGLGKSAVIGFVVTVIACYRGYRAEGGARGVGIATTQAVVGGLVAIFAIDYIYTAISLSGPQQPAGGLGG